MNLRRLSLLLLLATAVLCSKNSECFARAQPADSGSVDSLLIRDLGRGSVVLDGTWQFHLGDSMDWAQPGVNDAPGQDGWESIRADEPWGVQGHHSYTGYAWYRRHLTIRPVPDFQGQYLLLMPRVSDAYEVYWNGMLIGHNGKLPPHPSWPSSQNSHIFGFPGGFRGGTSPSSPRGIAGATSTISGTLAVRVWMNQLGSSATGNAGGLTDFPLLGDSDSIEAQMAKLDYEWLRSNLYNFTLNILYGLVAILAFLLWLRRRREPVLLWLAIFAGCPVVWGVLFGMQLSIPNALAVSILQPMFSLRNVSLWFLLLWMLDLHDRKRLLRWAKVLAAITLIAATLDGLLTYVPLQWSTGGWTMWADASLTAITTVVEVFSLVIIIRGLRRKLDSARWAIAGTAFISHMLIVVTSSSQQGQRFTHWRLSSILNTPLFFVDGVYFNAQILADTLLFIAILYAVYRYTKEQRVRQASLEQEMQSAREIQQVLIPEDLPEVQGFAVTSAYQPAREVGGDFFQIIPFEDGETGEVSTLIALGDVSGKGLKAAMNVAMIVGVLRTLADSGCGPAEMLSGLNKRMFGRMQGGFATAIVVRISPDGSLTLANAGHLPPYLNEQELDLPGSLPLGLTSDVSYDDVALQLKAGDHFSLYTDGVLEARGASGELYGFERVSALFAGRSSAQEVTEAAVAFGQDGDITVLTLERLAAGVRSSSRHSAGAVLDGSRR